MLAESFNIHMTLSPIFAEFSDFPKVRKSEKDAVAKVFAIHSHTLPYTPIHSHTLPYTPIHSHILPYTPVNSRTLPYTSVHFQTTFHHQHSTGHGPWPPPLPSLPRHLPHPIILSLFQCRLGARRRDRNRRQGRKIVAGPRSPRELTMFMIDDGAAEPR